jgi:Icc-related predicted phosphoesterase
MSRIYAISDLHTDYKKNLNWVSGLSAQDYKQDYLICAGDISHNIDLFTQTCQILITKFKKVFFVPGNHDLWIRDNDAADSLEKFKVILNLCVSFGIETKPFVVNPGTNNPLLIIPLFSWYVKPEEGGDSLFLEKPGDDPTLKMWVDNREIKWPEDLFPERPVDFFLEMNETAIQNHSDIRSIITFSHFLPRQDLIFPKNFAYARMQYIDPYPQFNFTRVAGSTKLEGQIRKINSRLHIYGHLHRNRFRTIDEITYVAHVLGNPKERIYAGIQDRKYFPKLIWSSDDGLYSDQEN